MGYCGKDDGLFFLSAGTGAGEELCWDFVQRMRSTSTSFTAYTKELTHRYETQCVGKTLAFMATSTFVKLLLSWIAALDIDFRLEVDPWCCHNPRTLVVDGTHLGTTARLQKLRNPVAEPDSKEVITPLHKRLVELACT